MSDTDKDEEMEICYHCGYKMPHYNDTYTCPSCGNYFYGENEDQQQEEIK